MGKNTKRIWNAVVGAVEFWAVFGFIDAWWSGDAIVLGTYLVSTSLAMQTYAALGVGAGIFLFLWNKEIYDDWHQERRNRRPDAVFRGLHDAVVQEFRVCEEERKYPRSRIRSPASKEIKRTALQFGLRSCGVKTPNPNGDDRVWYNYLTKLIPLTMQGRLDEAKEMFE